MQFRNDDRIFISLCRALGDAVTFAIIKSTMNQSLAAVEISKAHRIPVSSVYKKIRKLRELGVIGVDKIYTDEHTGKRTAYFRCKIDAIELSLNVDGSTNLLLETHAIDDKSGRQGPKGALF